MSRSSVKERLRYWPSRTVVLSPAQVAGATTATESFAKAQVPALAGLRVDDIVIVKKAASQAGLVIVDANVTAEGTLAITFGNLTANPIVPTGGEEYTVIVMGSV